MDAEKIVFKVYKINYQQRQREREREREREKKIIFIAEEKQ